jgi:hypothetical protein
LYGCSAPYNYGCVGNVALLRRVTGDPAGASEMNAEALAGLDARLGREHHYSLTIAMNLASDYAELGRLDKARELGQKTFESLRSRLGADHPATLVCAANLAMDMTAAGDDAAGSALREDTLARYVATQGIQNPDTKAAMEGRRLDPDFDPPPI